MKILRYVLKKNGLTLHCFLYLIDNTDRENIPSTNLEESEAESEVKSVSTPHMIHLETFHSNPV